MKQQYESDRETFSAPAYQATGWGKGIAWYVCGWELVADEDTHWSGCYIKTGKVVAHMVGDDQYFTFERDDLIPLKREEFCMECGQVGCTHDGYDR